MGWQWLTRVIVEPVVALLLLPPLLQPKVTIRKAVSS